MIKTPLKVEVVMFDWHNIFDNADFNQCKINLARGLEIPIGILQKTLERCKVYEYLKGLLPANVFWDSFKAYYSKTQEAIINQERATFLTPTLNQEMVKEGIKLHHSYPTALLSDCSDDKARVIRELDVIPYLFDHLMFSCEVRKIKRSFDFFSEFQKQTRMKPEHCVFVDDNIANINFARNFGFRTFQFENVNHFREHFYKHYPENRSSV